MTDRELLELAAKAAGIKYTFKESVFVAHGNKDEPPMPWNPLDDDGDALRLAVKLGIVVEYRREVPACFAYHYALNLEVAALNLEVVQRNDQLDGYAATRRAIVRAAAELGRERK